jgi:hypothetical protein
VEAWRSRESAIGIAATALAVGAMAVDHLVPDDLTAFLLSSGLSVALAAVLFGWIVPRTKASASGPELAARRGLICGLLAVVSIVLLWLGIPFVLGGAAIALGLLGRTGKRRRLATAAVVIGTGVVLLGAGAYILGGSDASGA